MNSRTEVFALVDCNNFYASCEKLFDPALSNRPLVVLSNNDGCVVARSAEAKAIGVPMGAPWFKLAGLAQQHGIIGLSSNYALYADMSNRVVEVLADFTPRMEVYSIDECFLDLTGFDLDLVEYGHRIRERVARWLGLPVCVGIAPTKTLAKLTNHLAKKRPQYAGVCDLDTIAPSERSAIFASIDVGEVWGVGSRLQARLAEMGIHTVEALRRADPELIRRRCSIVLERTVRELNGTSCIELEELAPAKQQIMASRSFGSAVYHLGELREAVASHISRAAEKLRAQQSEAGAVSVMIRTSPFRPPADPQYQRTVTVPLHALTSDTRVLIGAALRILEQIYRPGFAYQKAGVMLAELAPAGRRQHSLFEDPAATEKAQAAMATMDAINRRWGRGTLKASVTGTRQGWRMRREHMTQAYTTSWSGLPVVLAR